MGEEKTRVLVVANRTAESDELLEALVARVEQGPAEFFLVVPNTPRGSHWMTDMHQGDTTCESHLTGALKRWRDVGLEVDGILGDPDPLAATQDAANQGDYDELIVSTLPKRVSKWLHLDFPHKAEHATGLPTTHVAAHEERASV